MIAIENIHLLGDLVLVKRQREERIGSLFIEQSLEGVQRAVVQRVGPAARAIEVGDTVFFKEGTGQPFWWVQDRFDTDAFDRDLLVMHEGHILGIAE